jgi:hypothetical protein
VRLRYVTLRTMATSLLSNLLYATNNVNVNANAIDNDNTQTTTAMSYREKQEIVSLLRATTKCIEEGTCDAVIYQTMGALHRYTAMCAGIHLSQDDRPTPNPNNQQQHHPAFVLPQKDCDDENNNYVYTNNDTNSEHDYEDALAYGWVEELSSNDSDSSNVAWNSVLALLVQKEHDDEPCLWITKEVLARRHHDDDDDDDEYEYDEENDEEYEEHRDRTDNAATELETLHSIPLKRRLRSCHYQNFYGDHRVVLQLKQRFVRTAVGRRSPRKGIHIAPFKTSSSSAQQQQQQQHIVLRCPSASAAKAWVDCLSTAKKRKLQTDAIELEMVDQSPSNEFTETDGDGDSDEGSGGDRCHHHTRIVNVIDSEDDDEENYGIVDEKYGIGLSDNTTTTTRLAEQLQESEYRKRALKLAVKQAAALERVRQQQQEKEEARQRELEDTREAETHKKEKQEAIEKQNKAAIERKQEEDLQRKQLAAIEKNVESIAKATTITDATATAKLAKAVKPKPVTAAEKQQQRMEREIAARQRAEDERARIEIEYEQKKKERVEQRRRDLEAQRKAAREQQRKKELRQRQKFLESEQKKEDMKASAMKTVPKKAVSGIFSTNTVAAKDASKDPKAKSGAKDGKKGSLWYSLDKQMSAFEANDEERKRKEAEERKEEKAKAEAEQEEGDPEFVRKRIAEEARQRQVQEEVGKRTKETEALRMKQAEAAKLGGAFRQSKNDWAAKQQQQGATSPLYSNSPTTSQHEQIPQPSISPPVPTQQQHHNSAANPEPSVPPLRHPHTQSWNKMHQPPYPPQQTHFQRPQQPAGVPYHQSGPTAQGYRQQQQQTNQPQSGSFGNPVHPYPTPPRQHHQPQPQPHTAQPQPAPHPTHSHSVNPTQHAAVQQAPQPQSNGVSSESTLMKNVLIQWGLQPPSMQVLKPVDELLCSIDGVFPPSFGVPSHEYFQGWKPISRSELVSSTGALEETKLKKSVRNVRFFLHPDKLPHDLTEDQSFLCKLLWDVINDAFEEYKKSKEDLDWM